MRTILMAAVFATGCAGGADDGIPTVDAPMFVTITRYQPITWTCLTGCNQGDVGGYRQVRIGTVAGEPMLLLSGDLLDDIENAEVLEIHPGTLTTIGGRPCIMVDDGPLNDRQHHGAYSWCNDSASNPTTGSTEYIHTADGNFSASAPVVR